MEKSSFFCRFMFSVALHMSGKAVLFPTAFTKALSARKSYVTNLSVYLQTVQYLNYVSVGLFAVTSLPKNRIADVHGPALAPAMGLMFFGSTGMSLQGNASSTRILLVVTNGTPGPRQPFGQVNAVNFGNDADFLRLLGNAYAAFYRIGQRRTA